MRDKLYFVFGVILLLSAFLPSVIAQGDQSSWMPNLFSSPLLIAEQLILILGLVIGIMGVMYVLRVRRLTIQSLNMLLGYFSMGLICFIISMVIIFLMTVLGAQFESILGFIGIALMAIGFLMISLAGKSLMKVISDVVETGISKEKTMIKLGKYHMF